MSNHSAASRWRAWKSCRVRLKEKLSDSALGQHTLSMEQMTVCDSLSTLTNTMSTLDSKCVSLTMASMVIAYINQQIASRRVKWLRFKEKLSDSALG